MTLAWHFLADDGLLRDGRPAPPDGEWLVHEGPIRWCWSGLYASLHVSDTLEYARGLLVCRVECDQIERRDADKLVCRRRRILWRADASDALRAHARWCARRVLNLWDAPDVMVQYLRTGNEELSGDARSAARAAAIIGETINGAANDAAWAAVMAAGWGPALAARTAGANASAAIWRAEDTAAAGDAERQAQRRDLSRRIRALEPTSVKTKTNGDR